MRASVADQLTRYFSPSRNLNRSPDNGLTTLPHTFCQFFPLHDPIFLNSSLYLLSANYIFCNLSIIRAYTHSFLHLGDCFFNFFKQSVVFIFFWIKDVLHTFCNSLRLFICLLLKQQQQLLLPNWRTPIRARSSSCSICLISRSKRNRWYQLRTALQEI